MTKEELKLEALKYLENFKDCANCKHRWGDCADELDEDCLINNCYSATPKEQDIYLASAEPREKRIAELEKENAELKKEWQEQVQKATDEGYARTLQTIQLTKAKEIINGLLSFVDSLGNYSGGIFAKAEQFLNSEGK